MIFRYGLPAAACILLVLAAGCTGMPAQPAGQTPVPPVSSATPAVSASGTLASSCSDDVCSVIPLSVPERSLRIAASPQRYSPFMSSTPGVGLEPVATGFNATDATFTWSATYGQFLSWDAPDYTVNHLGTSATGPGKKLYWTFTDSPSDTTTPVIVTATAKDPVSGDLWGTSAVTLAWDGNYSVTVQQAG